MLIHRLVVVMNVRSVRITEIYTFSITVDIEVTKKDPNVALKFDLLKNSFQLQKMYLKTS